MNCLKFRQAFYIQIIKPHTKQLALRSQGISSRPGRVLEPSSIFPFKNEEINRNSCPGLLIPNHTRFGLMSALTQQRFESQKPAEEENKEKEKPPMSAAQKLKWAVAEYGSTVIVFHVTISLASLGGCYMLVSSGMDMGQVLLYTGISEENVGKTLTNAGTFAVAYGVHKVFAPVRIMITLTATPFIVRYLRSIGFIKKK